MMVEAGGTEKAYSYYEAGAPKVTEAVIAGGLEECKAWIRESIEMQRKLVEQAGVQAAEFLRARPRLHPRGVREGRGRPGSDSLAKADKIADKAERNAATDAATDAVLEQLTAEVRSEFEGTRKEIKAPSRSLHEDARSQTHRRRRSTYRWPRAH